MATTPSTLAKSKLNANKLDISYEKFELENGLTLLVHEDTSTPLVAVNVWYHVGSKNESKGKTGFAHLFEHLMFNGSENHDKDYFKATEQVGATSLNGTTNADRTNYFQNVPKTALDYILWLESDRMGHLLGAIDQAKLDEQRGVVQNEKRQSENQPYGMAHERIVKACYPSDHPYSWTTIGSMEDLNAASLNDVQTWFKTYYGADNVVIALAGNIKPKEALEKVKQYFAWIPAGPNLTKMKTWVAPMTDDKTEIMIDQVPQARLYKVWNIPGIGQDQLEELDMLSDVLSVGKNSILYQSLVEEKKLASNVSASIWPRELGGSFYIVATAIKPEFIPQIENEIKNALNQIYKKGVSGQTLAAYKTKRFAQVSKRLETIDGFNGKSDILAYYQTYYGSPDGFKQSLNKYFNISTNSLKKAAQTWLSKGSYSLTVNPEKSLSHSKETVNRKSLPTPKTFPNLSTPKYDTFKLKNGITVTFIHNENAPLFSAEIRSDLGELNDKKPGSASLMASLLKESHPKYTASQLSTKLDQLGSDIHVDSDLHSTRITFSGLNINFIQTSKLAKDILENPKFKQKSFDKMKTIRLQNIEQAINSPSAIASRVFTALAFKNTNYAQPWSGTGTLQSVKNIELADIKENHKYIFNSPLHITISSSMPMSSLKKQLSDTFGAIKNKPTMTPTNNSIKTDTSFHGDTLYFVHKNNSQQATILAVTLVPPFDPNISAQLNILNAVLGGSFTSRINMNLREDKHWSYGARSNVSYTVDKRPLKIATSVQVDKTIEAILEINGELKQINGKKPINQTEFQAKQKDEVLSLLSLFQNNDSNVNLFSYMQSKNLSYNFFETYSENLKALKLSTVNDMGKKLLNSKAFIWVVVGDRAIFDKGKKKLPFKNIVYIDAVE